MNQKIEEYLNSLVEECIKSEKFSSQSDDEKADSKTKTADHLYQTVIDELLNFLTKEELDSLESVNFESDEGVSQFGEIISKLPGFAFLNVGDKLRQEVEKIKQSGQIPS